MTSHIYNVTVSTPMGDMDGSATIDVEGTRLSGILRLFGKDNPFSDGSMDEEGNFTFTGNIKMPIGKLAYTITGTLRGEVIEADCNTKMGKMKIKSKPETI